MVALTSLWLPMLLPAVFVFLASSILHIVQKTERVHRITIGADTERTNDEDT